jgi:hypothetical protein
MNKLLVYGASFFCLISLLGAPFAASAWTVSQGSDYSSTVNSGNGFKVCNVESNGRVVTGKARDFNRRITVRQDDGADAGCDQVQNPSIIGEIILMETCEQRWGPIPDACSGWVEKP